MASGIVDITHLLDKEEGTSFDDQSVLFQAFDDGDVFFYDQAKTLDFKRMFERDGKANTLEAVLTLPIRSASSNIVRDGASKKATNLVEQAIFAPPFNGGMSTPMSTVVAQMAQAIVYRKAFFERVWTERDDQFVYDKVAWRPASTCAIVRDKKNGAFRGFRQRPVRLEDTDEIKIKAQRAFVYIHGQHRDPMDGTSDLDIAYWCYQTKQKIRFLWYQFLEGQSLPKTIVKSRDEKIATRAARKLIGLRQGGVVGLTDQVEIDTLESSGKGAAQFKEALAWLDAEASNSVLAGFTDLGATAAGGTGSFALSKDQTDFFLMSEQAKSREMEDAINAYLIPDLVHYNFGPGEKMPKFKFGPIAEDDMSSAITLLQAVAVTRSPVLPTEFYNELIERVAGFLGMNTQVVREGLDRVMKEAAAAAESATNNPVAPPVAAAKAAIDTSTRAIINKTIARTQDVPTGT